MQLHVRSIMHSYRKTKMVFESQNENDTYQLGLQAGESAEPGDIFCLDGDLGVGKTVFTAGFAKGLGIETPICSPTFTILQTYEEGRLPLYHFDVYRIEDPDEMEEIGFDEYLTGEAVTVIEWADKFPELAELPGRVFRVDIRRRDDVDPDRREIRTYLPGPDNGEDNKC